MEWRVFRTRPISFRQLRKVLGRWPLQKKFWAELSRKLSHSSASLCHLMFGFWMPGKYHCKDSAVRFPPDFCVLLLAGQRSRGAWQEREAEYLIPATERAHTQQALVKWSNMELLGWRGFYHQKADMKFYSKLKFYFVYPLILNELISEFQQNSRIM